MSSLQFWLKIMRLRHCFASGLAAWAVALLSNGPLWFTEDKIVAAICSFFCCLGAGVYHYGVRYDVYAQKYWDLVIIKHPNLLRALGYAGFLVAITLARFFLPTACLGVVAVLVLLIILYSKGLDKHFLTKNITVGFICIVPLLLGFFSGHRLHPVLPPILSTAFFFYLSREALKDIEDFDANQLAGRFTVPIVFGRTITMKLAGVGLLMAAISLVVAMQHISTAIAQVLMVSVFMLFSIWGLRLLFFTPKEVVPYADFKRLDLGTLAIMISLLCQRGGI